MVEPSEGWFSFSFMSLKAFADRDYDKSWCIVATKEMLPEESFKRSAPFRKSEMLSASSDIGQKECYLFMLKKLS